MSGDDIQRLISEFNKRLKVIGESTMSNDEIQNIISEIREFRKETIESINKILCKIGEQQERIISVEKDFSYMSERSNERDCLLHKDFDSLFESFRKFKEDDIYIIIQKKMKEGESHIKFWYGGILVNFLGIFSIIVWVIKDFILKLFK